MRAFVFAAAVLAVTPALAQTPDAAPMVAAGRPFAADAPSMGIAGSFNKWSVPDAILIAGGTVQRIGAVYPDGPRPADEPLLEWWPNFAGIARSGEMGFTTGGVAVNDRRTGRYFTIWKKQPDGSWKWVYDGGSGASAAGVPGTGQRPGDRAARPGAAAGGRISRPPAAAPAARPGDDGGQGAGGRAGPGRRDRPEGRPSGGHG